VIVADDHPMTRSAVRLALEHDGFEVVAEVDDADSAVEAAQELRPDVCLLDINMPGNGIRAAERISAELPEISVVMLTASDQDDDLFDALRAGASGYLLKDTDPARLSHALRGVLSGEAALPRTLVARLVQEFRERDRTKNVSLAAGRQIDLTGREWEVLNLMRKGESTAEIAQRLFVAEGTVRTHISSILRKLRVSDRAAAVRLMEDEGPEDR
jgi:DNA-binding NarL/FixJ family response regulator